jgi:Uma2 family endonuclease
MSPSIATKARYTPEDLLNMPDSKSYELVDGQLMERKMGTESSWVGGRLFSLLDRFCEEHGLGWLFPADSGYQCFPQDPRRVRRPDLSFVRYGRFPGEALPKGWSRIPPDLAVEIVSPNDTTYELDEKLEDYKRAGVPLVWVINPNSRIAMVYRADGSVSHLNEDQVLSGDDVLPGFRCTVRDILPARAPVLEGQPNGAEGTPETG